jgi:Recombinase
MISGLLDNLKYTGYQVWNRRRRKTGGNRANPESEWVWSAERSHAALVPKEVWSGRGGCGERRSGIGGVGPEAPCSSGGPEGTRLLLRLPNERDAACPQERECGHPLASPDVPVLASR